MPPFAFPSAQSAFVCASSLNSMSQHCAAMAGGEHRGFLRELIAICNLASEGARSAASDDQQANAAQVLLQLDSLLGGKEAELHSDDHEQVLQCAERLWDYGQHLRRLSRRAPVSATPLLVQLELATPGSGSVELDHTTARLCQHACTFALALDKGREAVGRGAPTPEVAQARLSMCLALAKEWFALGQLEKAEVCLSGAAPYLPAVERLALPVPQQQPGSGRHSAPPDDRVQQQEGVITTLHDYLMMRAVVLWRLQDHALSHGCATDCLALLRTRAAPTLGPLSAAALYAECAHILLGLAVHHGLTTAPTNTGTNTITTITTTPGPQHSPNLNTLTIPYPNSAIASSGPGVSAAQHATQAGMSTPAAAAGGGHSLPARSPLAVVESAALQAVTGVLELAYEAATQARNLHETVSGPLSTSQQTSSPGGDATSRAIQSLLTRTLAWLAYCHVAQSHGSQALSCLAALGPVLQPEGGSEEDGLGLGLGRHVVVSLKLQALLLCGRWQDAEVELMTLVACDDAPVTLCMHAMHEMMTRPTSTCDPSTRFKGGGLTASELLPAFQQLQRRATGLDLCTATLQFLLEAAEQLQLQSAGAAEPAAAGAAELDRLLVALLVPAEANGGGGGSQGGAAGRLLATLSQLLPSGGGGGGGDSGGLMGGRGPGSGAMADEPAGPSHTPMVTSPRAHEDHMAITLVPQVASGSAAAATQPDGVQRKAAAVRAACHQLLWSRGVAHFHGRTFQAATELLQASQLYGDQGQQLEAYKVLTICALATHNLDRAAQYLNQAESLVAQGGGGPGALPVAVPFLQLKVALERGDAQGAASHLQQLSMCADYTPNLLEVVCQEACQASAHRVACDAFGLLHGHVMAGAAPGIPEADVLRNHISCLEKLLTQGPDGPLMAGGGAGGMTGTGAGGGAGGATGGRAGGAMGGGAWTGAGSGMQGGPARGMSGGIAGGGVDGGRGSGAVVAACAGSNGRASGVAGPQHVSPAVMDAYGSLAQLLNRAYKRLDAVAFGAFFGPGTSEQVACTALEWFVATGMRLAEAAGLASCAEPCTVMYIASCSMAAHHPAPTTSLYRDRRKAAALAMLAATAVSRENPTKRQASLTLARKMLDLSRSLTPHCSTGGSGPDAADEPGTEGYLTFLELLVAVVAKDHDAQHHILQQLPTQPSAQRPSPDHLLELALLAREGETQNLGTARACYQLALQQLVAQQPPPDAELVVRVIRLHLELSDDDESKLAAYREAALLMGQLAPAPAAPSNAVVRVSAGAAGLEHQCQPDVTCTIKIPGMQALVKAHADSDDDDCGVGGGGTGGGGAARRRCFPAAEVQWLVGTCYNRGAQHARFSRRREAVGFMQAAQDLMSFAPREYEEAHSHVIRQHLGRLLGGGSTALISAS